MLGLLDSNLTPDDQRQAQALGLMALGGSMVRGDFGGGLINAGQAMQGAVDSALKRKMTQAQIQDIQQQIGLRNLDLQRQQQQWDLMAPIIRTIAQQYSGQPAAGAQPAQGGLGGLGGVQGGQPMSAPPDGQQPPQQAPQGPQGGPPMGGGGSGSIMGLPMNVAGPVMALGGPAEFAKTVASYNTPTDFQKLLNASGIDPNSMIGRQLVQAQVAKQNYIAPTALRTPIYFDPTTGTTKVVPEDQLRSGYGAMYEAEALGKAKATPTIAYRGNQPVFSTQYQDVQRAQGGPAALPPPQPGTSLSPNFDMNAPGLEEAISRMPPQDQANIRAAMAMQQSLPRSEQAAVTPSLPPGVTAGADAAQGELSKKWTALQAANSEAQNTASYLQQIQQLAPKAAVGQFADKAQFANSLLSLVGSQGATDEVTAKNLLDKFSNQIVARLSANGALGTDQARTILQAAYPNSHMTVDAIKEAADNLMGAQAMTQAKARLLQDAANSRNPAAYTQREIAFDQAADPRLWQLQNMDAATAQKYLASMPPAVRADLQRRAAMLKQMGAF